MTGQSARDRIAASPLFDAGWYLEHYPHVRRSGQDPVVHYLLLGGRSGCDPGPGFNSLAYLEANPDVARAGMNPLLHYEEIGRQEALAAPSGTAPGVRDDIGPDPAAQSLAARLQAMLAGRAPGLGFSRAAVAGARAPGGLAEYAILTPTGDRVALFNRCLQMVVGQSVQPREWIIVDDGRLPLDAQMVLPDWATYVRRQPGPGDPPHSLSVNLLAALEHVTCDRVLIFEDDDWYAPLYAEFLLPLLEDCDLVGLSHVRYYLLRAALWKSATLPRHTALAQSAFRRGHAWDHLVAVCRTNFPEVRERGVLDRYWWQSFEGRKRLIPDHPGLHLGLKGGFGREGLAEGHRLDDPGYMADADGSHLRQALGVDIAQYRRWQKRYRKPYALYTVITGRQAPPDPPPGLSEQFDLYAFCDRDLPADSLWEAVPFDACHEAPALQAFRPRVLPHLYFPDYEWSLWIDPAAVPARQGAAWVSAAIEAQAPLAEVGACADGPAALVRRHGDPQVVRAMALWWRACLVAPTQNSAAGLTRAAREAGLTPLALAAAGS